MMVIQQVVEMVEMKVLLLVSEEENIDGKTNV